MKSQPEIDSRPTTSATPEILYKYREWAGESIEYTKSLIKGQAFFATQPQLNDPFEYRWFMKRPETPEKAAALAAILMKHHYPHLTSSDNEYRYHRRNITLEIWSNIDDLHKMFRIVEQGVFCACEKNDDIRMWSHYGGRHGGVCVGFRTRGFGRRFASVKYTPDLPVFDGIELFGPKAKVLEAPTFKSVDWEYENEWRTFFTPGVMQLSKGIISQVILGCEIPPETRVEFINFVQDVDPSIAFYEAVLSDTQYKLIVRPLEWNG